MQKKRNKKPEEKKTKQFHKTWPTELSFDTNNLSKKDTLCLLFLWRFVKKWAIPEFICDQTFWRFTEDVYKILRYKIQKKLPISRKYVLESCPFTPYIFIKNTLGL